ncbi:MAG: TetR/AcrR family transcriptional regulator [Notoacmeibacter sp.]|nr:TetR/AcrR family transcriptional regulator [Notoacmeibacter sp.]MCC0032895.1 TetR/AcrR family transcriptional regulator [Brucellaceae bacterium]
MTQMPDSGAFAAGDPRFEILLAAAECFEKRGYASTSIDDVARKLGATKGRVYHHFPSKTDLFAAVYKHGMDMLYRRLAPIRAVEMAPLDKLRAFALEHARMMISTKAFQRVVWEGVEMHLRGSTTPEQREALDELLKERHRYSAIFRAETEAAKAAGLLAYSNISIANQLMFMTLNSPIFWYTPRPGETAAEREKIARQVVQFALRGLGAREEDIDD